MTALYGESMQSIMGPLKTINITLPTPQETLMGTPEDLPTTEPATSQIIYTIQASDLAALPPGVTCKHSAVLYAAGKNTAAGSLTVYYKVLKNGTSVTTGNVSVPTNNFYTWSLFRFYDVAVDDVIECRLWASGVGMNWDFKGLAIPPTRILFGKIGQVHINYTITPVTFPTFTLGTFRKSAVSMFVPRHRNLDLPAISSATNLGVVSLLSEGAQKLSMGDVTLAGYQQTGTTYHPDYYSPYVTSSISFRETPIIVP